METVGLGVSDAELGVNLGLPNGLAGHLQISDKIIILSGSRSGLDDFEIVGWVFRLQVGV